MKNIKFHLFTATVSCATLLLAPVIASAKKTDMISVKADVVEIGGSLTSTKGFSWYNIVDFAEGEIPGLFMIGQFQRKTALQTKLQLMESEGRAQTLSNPTIVVNNGQEANISVGGSIPMPNAGENGSVSTALVEYGVKLTVLPTIIPERNRVINASVQIEVSNPDYSNVIVIGAGQYPSFLKRTILTHVELNSGETLVIGGLKSSRRNIAEGRVPFLGKLPLIGLLFKTKTVIEDQRSLFLFLTVELVE